MNPLVIQFPKRLNPLNSKCIDTSKGKVTFHLPFLKGMITKLHLIAKNMEPRQALPFIPQKMTLKDFKQNEPSNPPLSPHE